MHDCPRKAGQMSHDFNFVDCKEGKKGNRAFVIISPTLQLEMVILCRISVKTRFGPKRNPEWLSLSSLQFGIRSQSLFKRFQNGLWLLKNGSATTQSRNQARRNLDKSQETENGVK